MRSSRKRLLLFITSTLLALHGSVPPGKAAAQAATQTTEFTYPVSRTETNPCNGEAVQLAGQGRVLMRFTVDGSGGIHVLDIEHTLGALSGGGLTTAAPYKAQEAVDTFINTNGQTPQFELTFVADETLVAQGSVPNFIAHTTVHVTVNADGLPTADVLNMKIDCQG